MMKHLRFNRTGTILESQRRIPLNTIVLPPLSPSFSEADAEFLEKVLVSIRFYFFLINLHKNHLKIEIFHAKRLFMHYICVICSYKSHFFEYASGNNCNGYFKLQI